MKVLLDTNAYSALRRGHELVADRVRNAEEVLVSIVVIGELLFGFRNGSRYEENAQALRAFLDDPNVRLLPVTRDTAAMSRDTAAVSMEMTTVSKETLTISKETVAVSTEMATISTATAAVSVEMVAISMEMAAVSVEMVTVSLDTVAVSKGKRHFPSDTGATGSARRPGPAGIPA